MDKIQSLLFSLKDEERKLFMIHEYNNKTFLHHMGDTCNTVSFIIQGSIVMTKTDEDGNESVFNLFHAPSIFGNNLIFSSSPLYLSDIMTLEPVVLYEITKEDLFALLRNNAEFFSIYMSIIADKTITLTKRYNILSLQNLTKRMKAFLEWKWKENQNVYVISSITSFAKELCIPRETASRLISKLQSEGYLTYTNKCLTKRKSAADGRL